MSPFDQAVNTSMRVLARMPGALFVGQSVAYDGAAIHASLEGIGPAQRVEMPVVEDFQLGYCIGLALGGKLPICIFPRMDFMLLCMNQLVNHLDKLPTWGWHPKIILRTTVGKKAPLNAGPQHTQNHTSAFARMLTTVAISEVRTPDEVTDAYRRAASVPHSSLIVENPLSWSS